MTRATLTTVGQSSPAAHPALARLNRLIGTWKVVGHELSGQVTFAWLEGGHFVVQHIDLIHRGRRITGSEYIGYDQESGTLRSLYFGNQDGPLAYTWEIEGDMLTIWNGPAGSPVKYRGVFSDDGNVNAGWWTWPGGAYDTTMIRLAPPVDAPAPAMAYHRPVALNAAA